MVPFSFRNFISRLAAILSPPYFDNNQLVSSERCHAREYVVRVRFECLRISESTHTTTDGPAEHLGKVNLTLVAVSKCHLHFFNSSISTRTVKFWLVFMQDDTSLLNDSRAGMSWNPRLPPQNLRGEHPVQVNPVAMPQTNLHSSLMKLSSILPPACVVTALPTPSPCVGLKRNPLPLAFCSSEFLMKKSTITSFR